MTEAQLQQMAETLAKESVEARANDALRKEAKRLEKKFRNVLSEVTRFTLFSVGQTTAAVCANNGTLVADKLKELSEPLG